MKTIRQHGQDYLEEKYTGRTSNQSQREKQKEWRTIKDFAAYLQKLIREEKKNG